ncbi:unnamed protein product, partial [Prorocentrum cordatum]
TDNPFIRDDATDRDVRRAVIVDQPWGNISDDSDRDKVRLTQSLYNRDGAEEDLLGARYKPCCQQLEKRCEFSIDEQSGIHARYQPSITNAPPSSMANSENDIAAGPDLLAFAKLLANAFHAPGAATLHPPWATSMVDKSHRHIAPPTTYQQPDYVELQGGDDHAADLFDH